MKNKLLILALVGAVLMLSGCDGTADDMDDRFITVYGSNGRYILVDKDTRVEYLEYGRGLTVLLDTDGKPLVYMGEF